MIASGRRTAFFCGNALQKCFVAAKEGRRMLGVIRSEAIHSSVSAEGICIVGPAAIASLEDLAVVVCFDLCG